MNSKIILTTLLLLVLVQVLPAQEKSRKELKEEELQAKLQQTEALIASGDFVFVGRWALPMGTGQVSLSSNPNYVRFSSSLMDGYMPYFGTVTAGIGFSGDPTIKFKDTPVSFDLEKRKKNYQLDAKVKGENDVYRLSLSIRFDGSANLTITSNNRGTISYEGDIFPAESIKYR